MSERVLFNNINEIIARLFKHEKARITKAHKVIIKENVEAGGSTDGFKYLGVIYTELEGRIRTLGNYQPLHFSLHEKLEKLLNEEKVFEEDQLKIKMILSLVLKNCLTLQDMRDALPECLKDIMTEFASLERTREEAWTLLDNPRSYKQYLKLRDRIQFYSATRLIY